MVVLRARTGTMVPMKGKGKLPWTSAGLLFHLRSVSHLQQCGGSHTLMWTSVTSSLLSFPSFLPDPSLASPMGALHPPPSSFPGQTPPDIVTKLPADWSFRNQEGARGAAILYPCLCYSFTKQSQAIQSHSFSRESRRWKRCNVRNQHLVLSPNVPVITFVNNSRGIYIWEI